MAQQQPFIRCQILQWEEEGVHTGRGLFPSLIIFKAPEGTVVFHLQQWDWYRAGAQMFAEYCGMKKGDIKVQSHFLLKST